jgi:hypothetical protein
MVIERLLRVVMKQEAVVDMTRREMPRLQG